MSTISTYFANLWAVEKDRENLEKYKTSNLDTIELIEEFAKKNVEKRADELSDTKAEARINAIKDKFELDTILNRTDAALLYIRHNEMLAVRKPNLILISHPKTLLKKIYLPSIIMQKSFFIFARMARFQPHFFHELTNEKSICRVSVLMLQNCSNTFCAEYRIILKEKIPNHRD